MKPANVEITMGHDIGISESYYRPQERVDVKEVHQDTPITAATDSVTENGNSVRRMEARQTANITSRYA